MEKWVYRVLIFGAGILAGEVLAAFQGRGI